MNQYTLATQNGPDHDKIPSTLTSNCDSILKYGRYIDDVNESPSGWQPDGCAMKTYHSIYEDDLNTCFKPGDEVIFFGDSTVRQVYWGFVNTLYRGYLQKMDNHADLQVSFNGVTVTLYWSSYFNETNADIIRNISRDGFNSEHKIKAQEFHKDKTYKPKTYLYMSAGSWFAGKENPSEVATKYRANTIDIFKDIDNRVDDAFEAVYFSPPLIPHYDSLDKNRQISMTHSQIHSIEEIADELFNYVRTNETVKDRINPALYSGGVRYRTQKDRTDEISAYYVPVFNELSAENHQGIHDDMGIHFAEHGFLLQANILLNHICNDRIAQEMGRPPAGATCCVQYDDYKYNVESTIFPSIHRILDKALLIVPLFALVFSAYRFNPEMAIPVLKTVINSVVVQGIVTAWARISNETQLISKVSIYYSSTEMTVWLQIWSLTSILSIVFFNQCFCYGIESLETNNKGKLHYRLSIPLLLELQGVCVSLLLIIQFTGYNLIPHIFDGELYTRVLMSIWSLVELYAFCLKYFDSFKPIQIDGHVPLAAATLKQAYSLPLPVFSKSMARVVTLPMLLSTSVTYSTRNSLPGNFPQSYIDPACKIVFWYIFIYFGFPIINLMSQVSFETDNEELEVFKSHAQTKHKLTNTYLITQTFFLIIGSSIPQLIAPMILNLIEIDVFNSSLRAFISIFEDFWIMLFAVWEALYSCTQVYHYNQNISDTIYPGPMATTAAGVCLVCLFDIGKFAFAYYLPKSESGATHPISFIDRHQKLYELLLDVRGRDYNTLIHGIFVLCGITAYIILRLGLLRYTRKELHSQHNNTQYYYMGCWIYIAKFSYEILELYPYIFLAVSGTVRLHYLPTGVIHSSLVTRTYYFVSRNFVFPYFKWKIAEKTRKIASVALGLSVLILLAQCCASVWNDRGLKVNRRRGNQISTANKVDLSSRIEKNV
ncbi:uncharacterized protein SAPINGB_P002523 [Magnusiomyces paraingens]|uniref:Cas1p 10 TM acyl transferase domain-containing protein n=1 Tax=Magnusiomyces paraingens TaxID=2606893 RepID=A0A5E8BEC6_9ASCO|nr:uncharacterized protein SAPINGB_P002523 [Saprochaete ingens]VVT49945.1 unnamed protein product [Saprochaete ingens]